MIAANMSGSLAGSLSALHQLPPSDNQSGNK
jgi:hypothetical protein